MCIRDRLSTDSAEPAAAAMESVSVSSEDSMESIINAVVQKILAEKGSNLSMSVDTKSEACGSCCSDSQRAEYDRIRHILDATPDVYKRQEQKTRFLMRL